MTSDRRVARVTSVEPLPGLILRVGFTDGATGRVDVSSFLRGPLFEPLREPEQFAQVFVDEELGTVAWPNGADLDPVVLRKRMASDG